MKAINITAALKAYDACTRANRAVSFYRDLNREKDLIEAKERASEREAELETASRALTLAIYEVEGRATARTASASDVLRMVSEIDEKLSISKKAKEGVMAWIDPNAQKFPNAYKYTPMSTQIKLEYHNGWKVTHIERSRCDPHEVFLTLTPEAEQAILDNYRKY